MPLFKYLLSIVFLLFASTALAAKPDNTLVCHVGSELGSSGESYQENPDCTIPDGWEGDYICPDAGKVDLISVSPNAKHIGNAAHSFLDAESYLWEDYAPEDGVGDDPADFEEGDVVGIDRGCELVELACPCWTGPDDPRLTAVIENYGDVNGPGQTPSLVSCTEDGGTGHLSFNVLTTTIGPRTTLIASPFGECASSPVWTNSNSGPFDVAPAPPGCGGFTQSGGYFFSCRTTPAENLVCKSYIQQNCTAYNVPTTVNP